MSGQGRQWLTDIQRIGIGITGIGVFFLVLGVIVLFNPGLIIMGNVLFLAGLVMLIGTRKTTTFFSNRKRWKGTACFALGLVMVVLRWVKLGILVEGFGFMNLFGCNPVPFHPA